jgi:hypothetical protein
MKDILLFSNSFEERHARDVPIGFLAINKNLTEWIELKNPASEEQPTKNSAKKYVLSDHLSQ